MTADNITVYLISYLLPETNSRVLFNQTVSRKEAKRLKKQLSKQGCKPVIHQSSFSAISLLSASASSLK